MYEDHPSLFKKGRKLGQGTGLYSMMDKSYKKGWSNKNTIMERDDFKNESLDGNLDNTRWRIYERQRIQDGKPASHYHETAIARDIANVKKRRK